MMPIDIDTLIPVVLMRVWCKDSVVLIWMPDRGPQTSPLDAVSTVLYSYN